MAMPLAEGKLRITLKSELPDGNDKRKTFHVQVP